MASGNYIKYARRAKYEPQSFYLASGSASDIYDELRRLGTRRVLFICNKTTSKYKNYKVLKSSFDAMSIKTFSYVRNDGILRSSDIISGLQVYKEFNCDTIIAVGGSAEIDCGKLISAMFTNGLSSPTELSGLDRIKSDISVLCCIVTDNSCAATTSFAEYYDETLSKWSVAMSAYLIPQVVVVDTDIAMRTDKNIALDCALTAFGVAMESYLSPVASSYPEYRANAIDSLRSLTKYIDLMMESPEESYYRRRVAVGALCSGVSSRITGYGISHLVSHAIMSKVGSLRSCVYLYILNYMLSDSDEEGLQRAAQLAKELGIASNQADDKAATEELMRTISEYFRYYSAEDMKVNITNKEASAIISEVVKEIEVFGIESRIKDTLERMFAEMTSNY